MTTQETEGIRLKVNTAIIYCIVAALIGFVIRAESHNSAADMRLNQLERRTDTAESDLKSIKEALYEIKGDVKLLIKGATK